MNANKFSEIKRILSEELTNLGINTCYIASFNDINDPLKFSSLVFACRGNEILDIGENINFPTCDILPEKFLKNQNQFQFVVQALLSRGRHFGYIIFESEASQGSALEIIKA